jgi:hypothetical protein
MKRAMDACVKQDTLVRAKRVKYSLSQMGRRLSLFLIRAVTTQLDHTILLFNSKGSDYYLVTTVCWENDVDDYYQTNFMKMFWARDQAYDLV